MRTQIRRVLPAELGHNFVLLVHWRQCCTLHLRLEHGSLQEPFIVITPYIALKWARDGLPNHEFLIWHQPFVVWNHHRYSSPANETNFRGQFPFLSCLCKIFVFNTMSSLGMVRREGRDYEPFSGCFLLSPFRTRLTD